MTQAMERREGADAPVVNPARRRRGSGTIGFYGTAVGKKWVMAITGIVFMGYVFAHMVGNLKMFQGRAAYDTYAETLRRLLYPIAPEYFVLWVFRIVLISALIFHIHASYSLTRMNQSSRPTKYQSPRHYIAATFASRSMRWTGIIVALFILFHLADLTFGWANPDFVYGNAYDNVVASLSRWPVAIIYIVANLALGVHLFHGSWSIFQSMGINSPRYNSARRSFAVAFAVVVAGLNILFPVAVLAGVVS
jgi:succinate dehydrogenase / fumarate reductase, cytochrome b subunit